MDCHSFNRSSSDIGDRIAMKLSCSFWYFSGGSHFQLDVYSPLLGQIRDVVRSFVSRIRGIEGQMIYGSGEFTRASTLAFV
jgi:hypothetical protein